VCEVGDFCNEEQIIAPETRGRLPIVSIAIQPLEGYSVAGAGIGFVLPDGRIDASRRTSATGFDFIIRWSCSIPS
jgi:hypothetical protein